MLINHELNHPSRAAVRGERLLTCAFNTSTTFGFCSECEPHMAVRVPSGAKLAFDWPISFQGIWALLHHAVRGHANSARFRRLSLSNPHAQSDALELDNGRIVPLNFLSQGQSATVVQLPALVNARTFLP